LIAPIQYINASDEVVWSVDLKVSNNRSATYHHINSENNIV